MKKILLSAVALTFAALAGAPAYAQASRTWVSGTGDDLISLQPHGAVQDLRDRHVVDRNFGEINCLDPGGFGAITINKQITIDCTGVFGGIASGGTTGVNINVGGGAVTLRGLTINGGGTGLVGVKINAASKVNLESMEIYDHTQQGVLDARTAGGTILVIQNSTIRNNNAAGIAGLGHKRERHADRKRHFKAESVWHRRSERPDCDHHRIEFHEQCDRGNRSGRYRSGIHILDSTMAFNGTGAQITGSATMANNSVGYNTTGFGGGGTITSYGNNRVVGNVSVGQALVAAGAASTDLGQK